MLSEHERQTWDRIERRCGPETEEAAGACVAARPEKWRRRRGDLPSVVVGGGWGAVLLVLFGVPMAGVAVGAAAGLMWLLWRFFPQVDPAGAAFAEQYVLGSPGPRLPEDSRV
ncbi:hypothetical protein [Geodermatophilus sp. URMC 64]